MRQVLRRSAGRLADESYTSHMPDNDGQRNAGHADESYNEYYKAHFSTHMSDNTIWGPGDGWDYDQEERLQHRHKMKAAEEKVGRNYQSATWDQAGKHVQIGFFDDGFVPHIGGHVAVRTLSTGQECVAMSNLVMRSGVHSISVHAGNYKRYDGHVRVGVGPPAFFERPARMSAEQEKAQLPRGWTCDGLIDDYDDLPNFLADVAAGGVMWSGADGKVYADGKGAHWGDGDDKENCYTFKDLISLKLDLDLGVLEVYKNGTSLGVISENLRGPLCWACELWYTHDCATIVQNESAI